MRPHLRGTRAQQTALDAATDPSAENPIATLADIGGGDEPQAIGAHVIGPFPFDWNTPGVGDQSLRVGPALAAGTFVLGIYLEIITPFDGTPGDPDACALLAAIAGHWLTVVKDEFMTLAAAGSFAGNAAGSGSFCGAVIPEPGVAGLQVYVQPRAGAAAGAANVYALVQEAA